MFQFLYRTWSSWYKNWTIIRTLNVIVNPEDDTFVAICCMYLVWMTLQTSVRWRVHVLCDTKYFLGKNCRQHYHTIKITLPHTLDRVVMLSQVEDVQRDSVWIVLEVRCMELILVNIRRITSCLIMLLDRHPQRSQNSQTSQHLGYKKS
jgi:hypothetical protein